VKSALPFVSTVQVVANELVDRHMTHASFNVFSIKSILTEITA